MKLKDFFFESDDSKSIERPVEKQSSNITRLGANNATEFNFVMPANSPVNQTLNISSQDTEKFKAHFETIFDQANLPGPDYYEFSKMVESMGNSIPIDIKINASYNGLKVQGLTKQTLISSANQYISILDSDLNTFTKKISDEVSSKKKALEETKATIDQKNQMIAQLQTEVAQHMISLNEFNSVESKMNEKLSIYQAVLTEKKNQITEDLNRINLLP